MRTLTDQEKRDIESLVDACTMELLLDALVQICHEKSEHVSSNWQDKALARRWMHMAARLAVAEHTAKEFSL